MIKYYQDAGYRASHGRAILVRPSGWNILTGNLVQLCAAVEAGRWCSRTALCYFVTPSGGAWGCKEHMGGYPFILNKGVSIEDLRSAFPHLMLDIERGG